MMILRLTRILTSLLVCLCLCAPFAGYADSYTDAFFDDAVFLGDSLTTQLGAYVREQRSRKGGLLGDAKFLSATSYSLATASKEKPYGDVTLKVRGESVTPQEGLKRLGAGKVFIMLGLNDHAGYNVASDVNHYAMLINHIRAAIPGVMIVVETMTPIQQHMQSSTLNQANLDLFNRELEQLCREMGVYFIDIASPLKNSHGYLNPAYAHAVDDNVHLNDQGLKLWVQALQDFAEDMVPVLEAEQSLRDSENERLRQLIQPLDEEEVHYPLERLKTR